MLPPMENIKQRPVALGQYVPSWGVTKCSQDKQLEDQNPTNCKETTVPESITRGLPTLGSLRLGRAPHSQHIHTKLPTDSNDVQVHHLSNLG